MVEKRCDLPEVDRHEGERGEETLRGDAPGILRRAGSPRGEWAPSLAIPWKPSLAFREVAQRLLHSCDP
jgi:hypothetical protein